MVRVKAVLVALGAFAFVLVTVPVLILTRRAPRRRARTSRTTPVGSHFFQRTPPAPVARLDAEDTLVWFLIQLVTRCDPLMPRAEARDTRVRVAELLAAVDERPDYRGLARISGRQIRRLLRGELDPHHCYSYRPEPREPGERFGLLVFLHGHGLNLLFALEALRPLCDRMRLCLVAPSFGYGNWEAPGGVEAVDRATRFGLAMPDVDPNRVYLGGYSQGGAGVSRAGAALRDRFAGLIYISPTMEPSVIGSPAFAAGWRGRPVLVIQGGRDHNVHPRTVDAATGLMEAAGVRVTQHRDPGAGHFLFFARLDTVTDWVSDWMAGSLRAGRV
ncbi:alpha/beta hydrolase [Frigoriglobus tundricola]|uniref:Uncharacterized protein n=1 Tax=Frigoriglobus tundricola TaxID=2774151 RepID=A0A6M5YPH9_9BACT|nr:alpha/beta fold hydrolase [Frigoriglobus tundricola]QJW95905.1 hypothetical protein FTUN_3459 [Frigoriglobus tundricola]